ncbi:MAG: DNA/RNA non-specific endonuclease [Bacteroidaceae bacterium]|nr:DNA/RNA non-specific endonuclease [Bacteroidaceae bacterium]
MKKNYIIPETMKQVNLHTDTYLQAASDPHINDDGDVVIPGEGGGGNADDGCAKERNAWESGGLWAFLLMLLFFAAPNMSLRAQVTDGEPDATKTVESITFVQLNGTTVTYASGTFDDVTVLPGVGLKIYATGSTTSVDYLFCQMSSITYTYNGGVSPVDNNVNANWNIAGKNIPESGPHNWGTDGYFKSSTDYNASTDDWAWRLEYPHISESSNCQRVVKACGQYGITYSLEWDNSKRGNRWTVYTMCAANNASNVDRTNTFYTDPAVTNSPANSYTQSSTYSRGHLCPSADRLASTAQNKQTFFMTNMQPQYQNHNGGVWGTLEGYVRTKWQPTNSNDTLYVVKAATIENVTLNGSTQSGVITTTTDGDGNTLQVPKYFYMAFLYYTKSTNSYKAFALWTEQKSSNNDSAATIISNKISIDELELRTGIDFFCNLPDDIEATVEATATYWDNSSNSAKERLYDIPEPADDDTINIEDIEGAEIAAM